MGDVAGHALSAGFSVGDYSLAAVWAVNGNVAFTPDCGEAQSAEGFLENMMATAFVGVVVTRSIGLAELSPTGFLTGSAGIGMDDLGASVDFGYGFGWALEPPFNGNDASADVAATTSTDACTATCRVDEGQRSHKCSSNDECQGAQRTCSSYGWCQGRTHIGTIVLVVALTN